MSGRKDADACAIRVMLADDHRATLCGMAVVLDAPFAVDWLQRMDRRDALPARRGGGEAEAMAGTPSRRSRVRRLPADSSDTWLATQGGTETIAETRAVGARTSARVAPTATTHGSPWPDALLSSAAIGQRVSAWPTAVWHPGEHAFGSSRRPAATRRETVMPLYATVDDTETDSDIDTVGDTDARASHALLAAFGTLDEARLREPFARIQVRDGITLTPMGDPRGGPTVGAGHSGGSTKGAARSGTFQAGRSVANIVVTGAYSRSAELFEALSTTPCDVLVCDLAMGEGPHGDGLTMIGYLRRHYPCVKLIVHTMCLHACVLRNLQLLQVPGIVSKMDDLALVRRAVSAVHKGGTFHGPSILAALAQAGYRESDGDRPAVWSKREAEVIRRFVNGDPVKDIAKALNRSVKTVSTQKMSAMHKAGINSNAELYQYAAANGLLLMPGVVGGDAWQWCETATAAVVTASTATAP